MDTQARNLDDVLALTTVAGIPADTAVDFVGNAVDHAWMTKRTDVLRYLVTLAGTINRAAASETGVTYLDYYLGNLWNGLKCLAGPHPSGSWQWECVELENEIVCLRRALRSRGFPLVPNFRRCQIMTNLGNCYSTTGRFVEAVGAWNEALDLEPRFGMAKGNRAVGRWSYAKSLYDKGHRLVMAREAWQDLEPSHLLALEPRAGDYFTATREEIGKAIPAEFLQEAMNFTD